jgi:hypothetical protein
MGIALGRMASSRGSRTGRLGFFHEEILLNKIK